MNAAAEIGLNFLINAAWQLLVITFVALGADRLMRGVPRLRHFVWVAALLISLLLPLLSAAPAPKYTSALPPATIDVSLAVAPQNIDYSIPQPAAADSSFHVSQRLAVVLLSGFLLVFAYRCSRTLKACWKTRAIRRGAEQFDPDASLQQIVGQCKTAFAVRNCSILKSPSLRIPATVGVFRPALILPAQLIKEGDASALTAAVGHELAHVRRRDYLLNLIYEIIFLPLSVHPAAYFIKRRITQTRELRCDELVTERLLHADVYARSLVRLAGWAMPFSQRTQSIMVGMADADILEVRVMSLLKKTSPSVRRKLFLSLVGIVLLAVPCAAAASLAFNLNIDRKRAQEPSREEQEKKELRARREQEIKEKMQREVEELEQRIKNETNAEVKAKLEKELNQVKERMDKPLGVAITSEGERYGIVGNETREREERAQEAKRKAVLAQMARISMDQAIQIANSKTPGKVLECSLVGEHWSGGDEAVKPGLVLYHVVILSGDDTNPVINHVLVNAIDGTIFKTEREERRTERASTEYGPAEEIGAARRPIEGGVLNGKAVSLPKAEYPAFARDAHASGDVQVRILIDESGNVISADAVSGHPLLRAAAISAAREARFTTTRLQGEPVKVSGVLVYNFIAQ